MFANTQLMGIDIGFPDVCLTPTPAPVPIPYPNIALGPMGVPAAYNVLFMCTPAHNLATTVVMTNGDNTGVLLGVVSHTVMAPSRHVTAAFTVIVGFAPATRMTSIAVQNMMNCPGVRLVPSQVKVIVLAP
ncbi:DUF4150 domain-containing protein [Polyangium aurulentum]|uniref:DUF4150 domain-containing protein n=1 Tax=Polyangium aurulentum TaxID=2567896 RepID=UPI0010ADB1F4|nr:DUF4150 domain-containing protein [Polyangium aurulentum]UQA59695.1 DUF4150 domain-containing protein [Polyangium aurulentum]